MILSFGLGGRPGLVGDVGGAYTTGGQCSAPRGDAGRKVRSQSSDVCHYCREVDHWKDKCPLQSESRGSVAMLCGDAPRSGFEPFITDARVTGRK